MEELKKLEKELLLFRFIRQSELSAKKEEEERKRERETENRKRKRDTEEIETYNNHMCVDIINKIFDFLLLLNVVNCTYCRGLKTQCKHLSSEEFKTMWLLGSTCKRFRIIILNYIKDKKLEFVGSMNETNNHFYHNLKKHDCNFFSEYHIVLHKRTSGVEFGIHRYSKQCRCCTVAWNDFLISNHTKNKWHAFGLQISYVKIKGKKIQFKFYSLKEAKEKMTEYKKTLVCDESEWKDDHVFDEFTCEKSECEC